MPGDPKECKQHAENCRRIAAEARTVSDRSHFLALADTWDRLAVELETSEPFIRVMQEIEPHIAAE
jgi:hypothetical protein